jgi:hypothetical protein
VFAGHYAVAFAAKRYAPNVSLGVLVAGAQLVDLAWPLLLLTGVEHVRVEPGATAFTPLDFYDYPWTHSLAAAVVWSGLAATACLALKRSVRLALVVGLAVFSHWVLDLLTHRPDLPLAPGVSVYLGLGLWDFPALTYLFEGGLFAGGLWLYFRSTAASRTGGRLGVWSLVVGLVVIYLGASLGPPPPSETVVAWSALGLWLTVAWAWWADRGRAPVAAANASTP